MWVTNLSDVDIFQYLTRIYFINHLNTFRQPRKHHDDNDDNYTRNHNPTNNYHNDYNHNPYDIHDEYYTKHGGKVKHKDFVSDVRLKVAHFTEEEVNIHIKKYQFYL